MEILNEGLVLFTAEVMIIFTDAVLNPYLRYNIGWIILALITAVSLINFYFIMSQFYSIFKKIFLRVKRYIGR